MSKKTKSTPSSSLETDAWVCIKCTGECTCPGSAQYEREQAAAAPSNITNLRIEIPPLRTPPSGPPLVRTPPLVIRAAQARAQPFGNPPAPPHIHPTVTIVFEEKDDLKLHELPIFMHFPKTTKCQSMSTQISRQTFANIRNNPDWNFVILAQLKKQNICKSERGGKCECRPATNTRKRDDQDPDDSNKRQRTGLAQRSAFSAPTTSAATSAAPTTAPTNQASTRGVFLATTFGSRSQFQSPRPTLHFK